MKKNKIIHLALLGLTHGLLTNSVIEGHSPTSSSHPASYAKAENGCPGGCPGKKTAAREISQNGPQLQDPSKVNSKTSSSSTSVSPPSEYSGDPSNPNDGNLGYHLMSEDELMLELNDEGVKQYQSLSAEGKALARELASQRCNNTNTCRGKNACKTEANDCAGQGSCKARSKCAFSDKNLAVKIAAKLMAEKRAKSLNGN